MSRSDHETLASEALHELRQPLMALKAWLQLWQEDPQRARSPEVLLAQVERLEQILGDYQRLLRDEPAPLEPLSLDAPVRAAELHFQRLARGAAAKLEVALEPGLRVHGNARLLEQLVLNLVSNARDALGPAGGRIRVATRAVEGRAVLEVADWGPGLPPLVKARLFEAWNTGKPQGTGLGLVVCRRIADAHGAQLELAPPESVGLSPPPSTVFRLTFPAIGTGAPRAAPAARARVLVVDDEHVIRVLFKELLGRDCEVTLASTAEEALAALEGAPPALLLADKNLPGLSGLELAAKARAKVPGLKVLLMTGYPSLPSAQQAAELGLLDYLVKPFDDVREVRARVLAALQQPAPARASARNRRVDVYEDNPRVAAQVAAALQSQALVPQVVTPGQAPSPELPAGVVVSWDWAPCPGRDALDLVRQRAPGVPFVVLAEHLTTLAAIGSVRSGAAACLPKLFTDPQALGRELARLLGLGPPA